MILRLAYGISFSPLKPIKGEMKGVSVKRGVFVRHLFGSGMVTGTCLCISFKYNAYNITVCIITHILIKKNRA